jgi:molybdenum cofactor guanylyltransferase
MTTAPGSRPPGLILAGGRSSRMGTEKAALKLGEDTILGHIIRRVTPQVSELAINAAAPPAQAENLPLLSDIVEGQLGPLAGILSGMRHYGESPASHFLSVPCDSPFVPLDLAERLTAAIADADTIVVAASLDRTHPVFALWPTALGDDLEEWLADEDNRRINAFLRRHRTVTVDFAAVQTGHGDLDPFLNINTPDDYDRALPFLKVLG